MLPYVLQTIQGTVHYGKGLVADIPDDQFAAQPIAGKVLNPPAWVLGHCAYAAANVAMVLGHKFDLPANANELFGMNSTPRLERSAYPSKDALLSLFDASFKAGADALASATEAQLAAPAPESIRSILPTVGLFGVFLLTSHAGTHLGQLSMWRRAMGMKRLF
jgi:hypothetical protein